MPALVNSKVGSLRGTSGLDGTISWPFLAKKSRNAARISLVVCMREIVALAVPMQEADSRIFEHSARDAARWRGVAPLKIG